MGSHKGSEISDYTPRNHVVTCILAYIPRYSLCMLDVATVACSSDFHACPVVDQSASVNTRMSNLLPLNLMPISTVRRIHCSRFTINVHVTLVGFKPNRDSKPAAYDMSVGTGTKTKKCPQPSDTMDCIAKEPKECSEEIQRIIIIYRSMLGAHLYLSMNTRPHLYLSMNTRPQVDHSAHHPPNLRR